MEKDALRKSLAGIGDPRPDQTKAVLAHLRKWLAPQLPGTATFFLAMHDEIDVEPLITTLPGWRWVLPRVEDSGAMTFRDRDVPRERHEFGMNQPTEVGPVIPVGEIDVFLVPGLAFDMRGGRLGRGGGFYDRALSTRRSDARAVGVTFETRVLPKIPMGESDEPMDFIVTEDGLFEVSS